MASVYNLLADIFHTEHDIVELCENSVGQFQITHFAAVRIQTVFRGYVVRKTIKMWNQAATRIQKIFRGWRIRYRLPETFHEHFDRLCLQRYTDAAVKIQALWKGYKVRKYELCIEEIIRNKKESMEANERMRQMIADSRKLYNESCLKECTEVLNILFDRHHLLRTYDKEGIFSAHNTTGLSAVEKLLNDLTWTEYMRELKKIQAKYNSSENEELHQTDLLKEVQEIMGSPTNNPKKPCASKNVDEKTYDKNLKNQQLGRDFSHNAHKLGRKKEEKPYYLDFWYRQCKIHNL